MNYDEAVRVGKYKDVWVEITLDKQALCYLLAALGVYAQSVKDGIAPKLNKDNIQEFKEYHPTLEPHTFVGISSISFDLGHYLNALHKREFVEGIVKKLDNRRF